MNQEEPVTEEQEQVEPTEENSTTEETVPVESVVEEPTTVQNLSVEEPASFIDDLHEFFKSHLIDTPEGFLQIFQSFTYGEMVISFLLLVGILIFSFKWIWEVLR